MSTPHTIRSRTRSAVLGTIATLTVAAALSACSSDQKTTEAAYCDAWAGVVTSFKQIDQVDIVQGGLDSVRSYVDGLTTSLDALGKASSDQLGGEVAKVKDAAATLADTVTSPSLPVDRREQVRTAKDQLSSAWADLLAKAKADCPNVAT